MDENCISSVALSICPCDGRTTTGDKLSVAAAANNSDKVWVKVVVLLGGPLVVEPDRFRLRNGKGKFRVTGPCGEVVTGGLWNGNLPPGVTPAKRRAVLRAALLRGLRFMLAVLTRCDLDMRCGKDSAPPDECVELRGLSLGAGRRALSRINILNVLSCACIDVRMLFMIRLDVLRVSK